MNDLGQVLETDDAYYIGLYPSPRTARVDLLSLRRWIEYGICCNSNLYATKEKTRKCRAEGKIESRAKLCLAYQIRSTNRVELYCTWRCMPWQWRMKQQQRASSLTLTQNKNNRKENSPWACYRRETDLQFVQSESRRFSMIDNWNNLSELTKENILARTAEAHCYVLFQIACKPTSVLLMSLAIKLTYKMCSWTSIPPAITNHTHNNRSSLSSSPRSQNYPSLLRPNGHLSSGNWPSNHTIPHPSIPGSSSVPSPTQYFLCCTFSLLLIPLFSIASCTSSTTINGSGVSGFGGISSGDCTITALKYGCADMSAAYAANGRIWKSRRHPYLLNIASIETPGVSLVTYRNQVLDPRGLLKT